MASKRISKAGLSPKGRKVLIALPSTSKRMSNSGDNKHSSPVLGFNGNARYSVRLASGLIQIYLSC